MEWHSKGRGRLSLWSIAARGALGTGLRELPVWIQRDSHHPTRTPYMSPLFYANAILHKPMSCSTHVKNCWLAGGQGGHGAGTAVHFYLTPSLPFQSGRLHRCLEKREHACMSPLYYPNPTPHKPIMFHACKNCCVGAGAAMGPAQVHCPSPAPLSPRPWIGSPSCKNIVIMHDTKF